MPYGASIWNEGFKGITQKDYWDINFVKHIPIMFFNNIYF